MKTDWIKFFPYNKPRDSQIESINFILDSFENKHKKYVVLECPTGVGKSAIAITVAKYFDTDDEIKSSWIVTPQIVLQKQYRNDFDCLSTIWSKEHYECPNKNGIMCPFGTLANVVFKGKYCDCIYKKDKKLFLDNSISLTNIAFFLNHVEYTDQILQRKVLIVDECHNIENAVTDFVSISINRYTMESHNIDWIGTNVYIGKIIEWITRIIIPKLSKIKKELKSKLGKLNTENIIADGSIKQMLKRFDKVDRYIRQLERCISRFVADEWVMSISREKDEISLKPIFASKYSYDQLFCKGEKILLMSGTILNKDIFCRNAGIPQDEADFLTLDSPFSKESRAVFVSNVCSLSYKDIDNNLSKVVESIDKLIETYHKNDKGIIHCVSYKIANYIVKHSKHKKRFIHHDSTNRLEMYELHLTTKEATILISPSLTEGIDLFDDLSRFQIIVKTPFPYLGDNYIKTKMARIPGWYEWQTTKSIMQASGRSVRNVDDYCITYILDSQFNWFYEKNLYLFPDWWKESLIFI